MVDHLAIFVEPFLSKVLSREKTVELRFSKKRCPPYYKVKSDDIVYIKKGGGKVLGHFTVDDVLFYAFRDDVECKAILREYASDACLTDTWVKLKGDSKYATIIFIKDVKKFKEPISIQKKNQLAWVVDFSFTSKSMPLDLSLFKNKGD